MNNLAEQTVRSTFPGVGLVPLISGAHFMGIAEKTARNWLVQKKFPIQTVTVGDKRFIPIPALIEWYSDVIGCNAAAPVPAAAPVSASQTEPAPAKRGRGRPRKIAGGNGGGSMTPAFNVASPVFSLPTFEQVLGIEKHGIVRLAKKFSISAEQIQAAAWLAHRRALAEVQNETDFVSVFFKKLKTEFYEEKKGGRRSVPTTSAHWKNDDGEFCEVEFSDENLAQEAADLAATLAEIDELRSRLTAGQLEILELLAEGPAEIARRFNVTPRRGQQIWKELFLQLKAELIGKGGVQPSLW